VSLKIEYSPKLITPELDRSMKNNIARKSGNKHVSGDTYKKRKFLNKALDFVASTRAIQVVGKAHFESKQYAQAAILRKDFKARETAAQQQITLSDEEYDSAVWNSNGVQNRLTREDHVRYGVEYYDYKLGEETTPRNRWALRFSKGQKHQKQSHDVWSFGFYRRRYHRTVESDKRSFKQQRHMVGSKRCWFTRRFSGRFFRLGITGLLHWYGQSNVYSKTKRKHQAKRTAIQGHQRKPSKNTLPTQINQRQTRTNPGHGQSHARQVSHSEENQI